LDKILPDLDALTALIEPEAAALGLSLVRVKWFKGDEPALQVMAERPDTRQLVIEDCAALSRRISDRFDELDPIEEAYRLEVSSPGIDRPLTRLQDFTDWSGHEARVVVHEAVDGRMQLRGDLVGVDGSDISIDDRKHGRINFTFDNIATAKLLLTDRLIAATAPIMTDGADAIENDEIPEDDQDSFLADDKQED
jgi:ribosome maturation factor RimP